MNILVMQNAIGGLDKLLGEPSDALRQIEAEAYGCDQNRYLADLERTVTSIRAPHKCAAR